MWRKSKVNDSPPDPYTRTMHVTKDGFFRLLADLEGARVLNAPNGYVVAFPVKVYSGGSSGSLFHIRITETHYAALMRQDFTDRYTKPAVK